MSEILSCTGPPYNYSCNKGYHENKRGNTYKQFAYLNSVAMWIRAVEKPPMEFEHSREKAQALIFACYLTGILVNKYRGSTWLGKIYLISPVFVCKHSHACN